MISLLNKKIGSRVAHHLGLNVKEGQRFTTQAARSSIGGEGVGFSKMSLKDQNKFIDTYNRNYNTPKNRSIPERLASQERESFTPQQKMARYESQRTVRDEGIEPALRRERKAASSSAPQENAVAPRSRLEPTTIPRLLLGDRVGGAVDGAVNATRAVAREVSEIPRLGAMAGEGLAESVMGGVAGVGRFASHAGEKVGGAARSGLDQLGDATRSSLDVIENVAAEIGNPNSGLQKIVGDLVTEGPDAVRNAAGATMDAVSNNPLMRVLAGDTSGRAASNASSVFQRNYEDVFSSPATAEAFGVDQNILKQAFSQSGDDFTATLKSSGLGDDAIEGLEAFRGEVSKVAGEGGNLSAEGMQAMLKNQAEAGNMYAGFSRAGATASPNALLRGMAGEGTGMESVMGIAAVAGLAGGANVMMGGEFTEGAAVGGIGALSVKGIAKGVAGSMGDIEQSMMKSILGDDMVTAGSREVTKDVTSTVASKGTRITDLTSDQMSGLKLSDVTNYNKTKMGETSVEDYVRSNPKTKIKLMDDVTKTSQETVAETVTGGQARRQNLTAIQKMSDDDERLQGFGKKKMKAMLNPNKEKNVAMNNRALVLGGGMLSGVAFTGTADRRDYRRGFNAHRGNRI